MTNSSYDDLPNGKRRRFLQGTGAALGFGALPMLPACGGNGEPEGDNLPEPAGSGLFRHGVASGDPLFDRVLLWTRVTPDDGGTVDLECIVATDPAMTQRVARFELRTDVSRDHTVKIDVVGLQPATTYYYRFGAKTAASPVGRTRTLPVGSPKRLRMAVLSCAQFGKGYFNAYRRVAERADLDLVLHLGDYLYEQSDDGGDIRALEPTGDCRTLADYRARHALYKRDPDLQEVHRQHPMVAIWDDHDIASDASANGLPLHDPATWPARVEAALQAYYEWMPIRVLDPANLRRAYRSFSFGDLVELMVLEQRLLARSAKLPANATLPGTFRQRDAFSDPSRGLLGAEQEAWLAERLRTSGARWKLIGQGVMMAQLKLQGDSNQDGGGLYLNTDQWDGYAPARDRLFQVLKGDATSAPIRNVIVLSGDAHSSWACELTPDPNNGDTYDPGTATGALATEFVTTSVTTPLVIDTHGALESLMRSENPHVKYLDLTEHGYLVVDIDPNRVVGEWWFVDTVSERGAGQWIDMALQVLDGNPHLVPSGETQPPASPSPLAP
jgi:alkaline phosphatase D